MRKLKPPEVKKSEEEGTLQLIQSHTMWSGNISISLVNILMRKSSKNECHLAYLNPLSREIIYVGTRKLAEVLNHYIAHKFKDLIFALFRQGDRSEKGHERMIIDNSIGP
jgi:hypothetical protein